MIPESWQTVTRPDGETVGYVEAVGDGFVARDLLGWVLTSDLAHDEAVVLLVERGLDSLSRSWDWTDASGQTRRVHVMHLRPGLATVSTGYPNVVGAPGERFEIELPVDPARFRPA